MKKILVSALAFVLCICLMAGCAMPNAFEGMVSIGKIDDSDAAASFESGRNAVRFVTSYFTFDAVSLVQAYMDLYFLEDFDNATLAANGIDSDRAREIYDSFLETELYYLAYVYEIVLESCNADVESSLISMIKGIYSNANYQIGEQYESGDDFYVTLTVYPIDVNYQVYEKYDAYVSGFNARLENGEFDNATVEEYENDWAYGLLDIFDAAIAQLDYLEPVEIEVLVELQYDGTYAISSQQMEELVSEVLAY